MFGHNASRPIDSLIGTTAQISGDLYFTGGLRIDGHVSGNVIAEEGQAAMLIISEYARIDGEVRCPKLVINGQVNGQVHCSELLELQPKARILGDVYYKLMEMHGGALVSGRLTHQHVAEQVFHLAVNEA